MFPMLQKEVIDIGYNSFDDFRNRADDESFKEIFDTFFFQNALSLASVDRAWLIPTPKSP